MVRRVDVLYCIVFLLLNYKNNITFELTGNVNCSELYLCSRVLCDQIHQRELADSLKLRERQAEI